MSFRTTAGQIIGIVRSDGPSCIVERPLSTNWVT